ncbi:hypothetical protein C8R47DRAFT_437086 [Mycena vitilis]|nr:hypothetical protein C8R47DRAFT_437086 [Mycena vitilis]
MILLVDDASAQELSAEQKGQYYGVLNQQTSTLNGLDLPLEPPPPYELSDELPCETAALPSQNESVTLDSPELTWKRRKAGRKRRLFFHLLLFVALFVLAFNLGRRRGAVRNSSETAFDHRLNYVLARCGTSQRPWACPRQAAASEMTSSILYCSLGLYHHLFLYYCIAQNF